jgi:hypothetical protein
MDIQQPSNMNVPNELNFPYIIFNQIIRIIQTKMDGDFSSHFRGMENLQDLLIPYWDKKYEDAIESHNNEFNQRMESVKDLKENEKNKYEDRKFFYMMEKHRKIFRTLMELISRSGFLPEKTIEGVLDEDVIDAFWEATGQLEDPPEEKREPERKPDVNVPLPEIYVEPGP